MAAVPPSRHHVTRQSRRDRAPLGGGFRGACRTTREGGGLPEGGCIPAGITHDLVLQFDLPARRMEREERLLAMHDGNVNETLFDIAEEGGGQDARFLLAHGAARMQTMEATARMVGSVCFSALQSAVT